jgi:hypothetical protein
MIQTRDGLGFALEALAREGVVDLDRKYLDRNRAVQLRIPRLIDLSHAARANECEDLIRT